MRVQQFLMLNHLHLHRTNKKEKDKVGPVQLKNMQKTKEEKDENTKEEKEEQEEIS